jgi:hypothetical protein
VKAESLGENDREVCDREKHQWRYCGNRRCKHGKNIGIGRDNGMDRVCGDRYRGADHEQHPRVPRAPLSGERDDGNGSDDDDPSTMSGHAHACVGAMPDRRARSARAVNDNQNAPTAMNTVPTTAVRTAIRPDRGSVAPGITRSPAR